MKIEFSRRKIRIFPPLSAGFPPFPLQVPPRPGFSNILSGHTEERQRLEQAGKIKPQRKSRASKELVRREKTICATDPDAGMLNRPGKLKGPHYLSHQSIDPSHGIIVNAVVTPGSANDSTPYLERIEYIR